MTACCLLEICCNAAERRQKAIQHYCDKGCEAALAQVLADDLLEKVDAFVKTPLGAIVKSIVSLQHKHKG